MKIRNAVISELEEILAIYELARAFMKETGNPDQWRNTYPTPQIVKDDIKKEELYVLYDEEGIEGVFVFINGPDPTYDYIDGNWLDDEPYYGVHEELLLAYCGCYGVDSSDVELLLEYGYTCDEIEDMLADYALLNETLQAIKFEDGESLYENCYGEAL